MRLENEEDADAPALGLVLARRPPSASAQASAHGLGTLMRSSNVPRRVTVRDKVGRTRYVAFRIVEGGPVSRPALSGALPAIAKLTRFDGTYGVLRTNHRDRDALLAVLKAPLVIQSKEVRLETLATSGTLRKAATALPAHSEASKRARAPQRG